MSTCSDFAWFEIKYYFLLFCSEQTRNFRQRHQPVRSIRQQRIKFSRIILGVFSPTPFRSRSQSPMSPNWRIELTSPHPRVILSGMFTDQNLSPISVLSTIMFFYVFLFYTYTPFCMASPPVLFRNQDLVLCLCSLAWNWLQLLKLYCFIYSSHRLTHCIHI